MAASRPIDAVPPEPLVLPETSSGHPVGSPDGDSLLAIVGHELRNPLHALSLQLSLAKGAAVAAGHEDVVARIEKSQRMLTRYIDRTTVLFELMRPASQGAAGLPVDTDLAALMRAIGEASKAEARYRNVDLLLHLPDTLVAFVDAGLVSQIVDNLLLNAFKHAAARQVTLTLRLIDVATERRVRIEVADDGSGIPFEHRQRVLDWMSSTAALGQNPRHRPGNGLGLWIVGRLAAAIGGTVELHDRPEGGTLFTIDFPLRAHTPA